MLSHVSASDTFVYTSKLFFLSLFLGNYAQSLKVSSVSDKFLTAGFSFCCVRTLLPAVFADVVWFIFAYRSTVWLNMTLNLTRRPPGDLIWGSLRIKTDLGRLLHREWPKGHFSLSKKPDVARMYVLLMKSYIFSFFGPS